MGLINNDVFEASNGVQKTGTYISFNNETLYLRKASVFQPAVVVPAPSSSGSSSVEPNTQPKQYSVNANYRIFWDKAARDAGKSFMELRSVSALVSESDLTSNLYAVLYAELKKQYLNTQDELSTRSDPATAPAPSSDPAPASAPSS